MKKALILILVVLMLLPAIACQKPQTDNSQTTDGTSDVASSGTQGDSSSGEPQLELPNTNLNGFTMTILRSSSYFTEPGVWSEEEMSGDQVSDEVFKRNALIEKTYNCKIELLPTTAEHPSHEISKYVSSGDGAVDMMLDGGTYISQTLQYYTDLNTLDYFDFEKPWWNQDFNKGVSLGNKLFLTVGSYLLKARQGIYHIIFNKVVADDIDIDPDSLYQMVRDNEWTLDVMTTFAKKAKMDLNGDGIFTYEDRYGLLGELYCNWTLSLGAGFRCVDKDVDDLPVVTFGSERNSDVIDAVLKMTSDLETTLYAERITGVDNYWTTKNELSVTNNRWLFLCCGLGDRMRTMEQDYGVLPCPKLDEQQDRYYHDASLGNSPVTTIPLSATDANKVAFILEAMSYYSYRDVLPVFYQNYLNTKLARDSESVEMLKLIHDSLYYDVGAMFDWGMHSIVAFMTKNTLAKDYDAYRVKIRSKINASLDVIGVPNIE